VGTPTSHGSWDGCKNEGNIPLIPYI
jgi:hypothetical protein